MNALAKPSAAGESLAGGCAGCHGQDGRAADVSAYPDLAGQSAAAIYKQLHDFKSGSRKSAVMAPLVKALTDEQMVAVAAHFAAFPPRSLPAAQLPAAAAGIEELVARGDPARRIPACNACHGDQSGGPTEAPRLSRQSREYLAAQLHAFKAGERRNDIYSRMRSAAIPLTDKEIEGLALFYASTRTY